MYTVLFENLIRESQIDLSDKICNGVVNGIMDPKNLAFSYRDYENTPVWFLNTVDDYLYNDAYNAYIFTINSYKDLHSILQIQNCIIQEHPQYDLSGCNIYVLFKNDNAYEDDIGTWFSIQRMMYNNAIFLLDVSQYGVVISRIVKDCNRYLNNSQIKKPEVKNDEPVSPDLKLEFPTSRKDYMKLVEPTNSYYSYTITTKEYDNKKEDNKLGLNILGKIESGEIDDPKILKALLSKIESGEINNPEDIEKSIKYMNRSVNEPIKKYYSSMVKDDTKENIKPSKPDSTISIDDNTNIPSMKEWLSFIGYNKKEEDKTKTSTKKEKVVALVYNKDTDNYRKVEELMDKVYDLYRSNPDDVKFVLRTYDDFIKKDSGDDNIEKYIIIADSMDGLYYLYFEYLDKRKCKPFTQEKDKWMLVADNDIYATIDYNILLHKDDHMVQSGLVEWALSNIIFLL